MDERSLALPGSSTTTQWLLANCLASVLFLSIAAQAQTFLIEAEDFNFNSGQHQTTADAMPYYGGAYGGLTATYDVDYNRPDDGSSAVYRNDSRIPMNDNIGDANRGTWSVNVNFKLGWIGEGMWFNYTRTFPAGNYRVLAALSYGDTSASALRGSMQRVTSDPSQPGQTLEQLGSFDAPGTGGWGLNGLTPMKDAGGQIAVVALSGTQTIRFTAGSGDIDYFKFVIIAPPQIVQQPASVTVPEGQSATFQVVAGDAEPATYQWQRNSVNIPGATDPLYFIPAVALADSGAKFRCVLTNPQGSTNTVQATLTVTPDTTRPTIVSVANLGADNQVTVLFSEAISPASGSDKTHFAIDRGVTVNTAALDTDGRSVILTTSTLARGVTYTLTVNGVQDRATAPNTILANSQRSFTLDFTPLDVSVITGSAEAPGPSTRNGGLTISEIMYHPATRADGKVLEFVEIYNSHEWPENLSGFRLSGNLDYTFPANTVIGSLSYLVVAAVPADVQSVYSLTGVLGGYTNRLSNGSGTIRLRNRSDAVLVEAVYSGDYPYPATADGAGHSLVLVRPSYGAADPRAWAASDKVGGSPGKADAATANPYRTVLINEVLVHTDLPDVDYVELYNYSAQAVDLSGCFLSDDPGTNKFILPAGTVIPAKGFVVFDEGQLGFGLSTLGETVFLRSADQSRVIDSLRFGPQANGVAFGRYPDGAPTFQELSAKTPGTANARPLARDIVINEIMYDPVSGLDDDQYVELYNRGSGPVDLSGWRFREGIDFTMPTNTVLAANGFLVVAKNTARLLTNYPNLSTANTVGDFKGGLANGGERLTLSMPAETVVTNRYGVGVTNRIWLVMDQVEYGTGGRWGAWAAGGGSSLELTDPKSDNRLAANWADSDETAKSGWTTVDFTGPLDNGNGSPDELQILMQGPGECLVDEVQVLDSGGVNHVTNSTFESGLDGWVPQGNHDQSSVEAAGYNSSHSLHVRGLERGDPGANRIRTLLSTPMTDGTTATIRAKVRWLKGHPEILFRLHGNAIEAIGSMSVAANLGTPGQPNSRLVANAGPAIFGVTHRPVLPAANEAVVVRAQVNDPDGLVNLTLYYRVDPSTNFTAVGMAYNGAGFYSATVPGQAADKLVAFYLRASDGGTPGASTRFPSDAPTRECLIRFGEPDPIGSLGNYHLWITQKTFDRWSSRLKLDNGDLDATFVYGDQRVVYNAGALYGGSPWISPGYNTPNGNTCGYVFHFPEDDQVLGATDFTLDWPSWTGELASIAQAEQTAFWMADQVGLSYVYRRFVNLFVNGVRRSNVYEDATQPNGPYIKEWFSDDTKGDLYKIDDWFEFDDGATKEFNVDATLQNFTTSGGAKKLARYRWNWRKRSVSGSANNYQDIFALVDALNATPDPVYQQRAESLIEVDQWMRVFALEHAVANWDSYGYNRGKNMLTYKPEHGKWHMLMWDIDCVFQGGYGATTGLFDANDPTVARMYGYPAFVRAYWRALQDLVDGPFVNANVEPVMQAKYAALVANGISCSPPDSVLSWISQRRDYIVSQLATVAATFAITSNGGNNYSVANNLLTLTGTAPVGVKTIEVNGVAYPPQWTSVTGWTLQIPLGAGANSLTLQGYDLRGHPIASATDTITVTYTGAPALPQDYLVINEIMYNPAVPDAGFVEIHNASAGFSFDLSNYRLNGADFTFPEGTVIGPGGFLVVVVDPVVFASTYGSSIPIAGVMNGSLQNNGETLSLIKPGVTPDQDVVIDRVRYDSQPPWPAAADGGGSSLQLIDPKQDHSRVANWGAATADTEPPPPQWTFVSVSGLGSNPSLYVYLNSAGDVYLDDLALVEGSVPNTGVNLLANGAFDTDLSGWTVSDNHAGSSVSTSIKRSGAGSLHLVATSGGTTRASSVWQTVATGLSPETTYTLSYWYLPSTNGSGLTLRLSYNGIVSSHSIAPPDPGSFTLPYTPGAANSLPVSLTFPRLWINEVEPANVTGLADRLGERDPWLEIFNAGTNSVDLASCFLANNYSNLTQWPFPAGTTIAAGQHLTVWADGQPVQTLGAELHTSFRLNAATGSVALVWVQPNATNVLDYLDYGYVGNDRSIGSYPEGQAAVRQIFHYPTPGGTNNPASAPVPIVINEWMASNTGTLADPADGEPARYDDWFELFNTGSHTVDLSGFFLTDTLALWNQWAVPAGTLLAPGAHLLVWADGQNKQNGFNGDLHASFQLSKGGEAIGLFAPDGTAIDTVTFGPQTNNISQGHFPDGIGDVYFMTRPTPRTANAVPAANQPPEITAIPAQGANEGTVLAFNAAASDPDAGDTLTFSLDPGAPSGASINPNTGLFTWTPTEAQGPNLYSVTIRVTDNGSPALSATATFSVTVNEVNSAPVLPTLANTNVNEGILLSFSAAASDPDLPAQTLAYALDPGAPEGASINPTTGLFAWTPTEAQGPASYSITVRVTDDGLPAQSDTQTFTVTVNEVNAAPLLMAVGDQTIDEGQLLQLNLSATDVDQPAQTITYSLQGTVPAGLTLTGNQLNWTPTEAQGPSTNTLTVKVTDNGAPAASDTKSFKIIVREANSAPALTIADQTVPELQAFALTLAATDADQPAQVLTYSLLAGPIGLALNGNQLSWTPTEEQGPSTNTVTVKVTDSGTPALSATNSFKIIVAEANAAPALAIAEQSILELQAFALRLAATDTDQPVQALTYTLLAGPAGLALNGNQLSWTPAEEQGPSTNTVTVKVTDDGSPALSATNSFKLVVREVNAAPTLAVIADQTADEGQSVQVDLSATDADLPAQTLTYSLQGTVPTGLTLTGSQLKWTPTEAQGPSTNTITVKVTDDGSPALSDTKSFKIVVREVNAAPTLASITDQTVDEGQSVQVDLSATDADLPAQTLMYSLQGAVPTGLTLTGNQIKWTPTEAQGPSTNTITVKVIDDGSPALNDTKSFKVVVREVNAAPILATIADQTVDEGQLVQVDLSATDADLPAQTLTYSLQGAVPTGLTLTGSQLKWTPTEAQGPSTNTVTVKVTDDGSPALSDTKSFKIVVREVNAAPVLASITDQTVDEGQSVQVDLSATDADLPAQTLNYSLQGTVPTGLTLTGNQVKWTPTEAQGPSTNTITVKVTDDGAPALSDTKSFKIVVREVNAAPTLAAVADQSLNLGDHLRLTLSAADMDLPAQQLTFSLDGTVPTGLSLVGTELTWTPTEAQCPSTNTITVKVTDDGTPALSATRSFTVVVQKSDFRILEFSVTEGQQPTLRWATVQGGLYRVESRTSLGQGAWELREELEAAGASLTWSDAIRAAGGERYYRVLKVR